MRMVSGDDAYMVIVARHPHFLTLLSFYHCIFFPGVQYEEITKLEHHAGLFMLPDLDLGPTCGHQH